MLRSLVVPLAGAALVVLVALLLWSESRPPVPVAEPDAPPEAAPDPVAEAAPPAVNANAIKSPMVGTVYLSPQPGASAFVKPGDTVAEGQTLLIIEAMKVMNPIPSPRAGKVKEILVGDAQPVEFDQPLIVVE